MSGNNSPLVLDSATAQVLEHLARTWGVSREEAVKRAVTQAEVTPASAGISDRLQAFKELQCRLQLTPEKAKAWQDSIRDARR